MNDGVQDSIKRIISEIVGFLGQVLRGPCLGLRPNFPTTKRTKTTRVFPRTGHYAAGKNKISWAEAFFETEPSRSMDLN